MALRHWFLLLAVTGVVAAGVGGTGAFSSVAADRGVSVAVAPPEDAYLGLSEPLVSTVPDGGARADLLTVTNGLGEAIDLTVTVAEANPDGGPSVTNPAVTSPLAPGEQGTVAAGLSCADAGIESITVSLTTTGANVRVEGASRTFDLTCSTTDEEDEDGQGEDDQDEDGDDQGEDEA